uniref:Ninjurin 2 n=1 Tax=Monodelphis domestica TaxID=13616 RepID=F6QAB2_MONDO
MAVRYVKMEFLQIPGRVQSQEYLFSLCNDLRCPWRFYALEISSLLHLPATLKILSRRQTCSYKWSLSCFHLLVHSPGPRNPSPRRDLPINFNHYTTKKSVSESMLDVALFMSNATRLKAVLERGPLSPYYTILVTLLSISLLLQVVIGILLIITARMNLNEVSKQQRLNQLNNTTMAMVFITVIINIFITAFGVQKMGQSWPTPKPY